MEKRTKLICVAPGLGITRFMRHNKSGLSVVQSTDDIDNIKSLIGQYDIVIVPYKETIISKMKKMDMNVLVVIPKVHRYSEVIELFIEDMKNNLLRAELEVWKQNIFVPIINNIDFISLDTGRIMENSINEIMESPLGYNYPSNWLSSKKFMFDKLDLEAYYHDNDLKRLLLEITKYSGNVACISSNGKSINLPNKVFVRGIAAKDYYKETELFSQMTENVIEINCRTLGCPKDINGDIDWKAIRQRLVIQQLLPKYRQ